MPRRGATPPEGRARACASNSISWLWHRIGHQAEGAAAASLVGDVQAPALTADDRVLAAPVELERLAQLEAQRHEPRTTRSVALLLLPALGKGVDRPSAAAVALRAQRPNMALIPRRSRLLRWLSALSHWLNCSFTGSRMLGPDTRCGYRGSAICRL